ncbi:hypothetical protein CLF_100706 [Clonorchis sinensis]|uniref:Uncharacterized protein n=1 Tax=Clonorchis sinensis TaxID=79923 RepID=G7Y422_CLOSI|nr:hypothetical protein CLF_100706 [Clonorchis sinensis]
MAEIEWNQRIRNTRMFRKLPVFRGCFFRKRATQIGYNRTFSPVFPLNDVLFDWIVDEFLLFSRNTTAVTASFSEKFVDNREKSQTFPKTMTTRSVPSVFRLIELLKVFLVVLLKMISSSNSKDFVSIVTHTKQVKQKAMNGMYDHLYPTDTRRSWREENDRNKAPWNADSGRRTSRHISLFKRRKADLREAVLLTCCISSIHRYAGSATAGVLVIAESGLGPGFTQQYPSVLVLKLDTRSIKQLTHAPSNKNSVDTVVLNALSWFGHFGYLRLTVLLISLFKRRKADLREDVLLTCCISSIHRYAGSATAGVLVIAESGLGPGFTQQYPSVLVLKLDTRSIKQLTHAPSNKNSVDTVVLNALSWFGHFGYLRLTVLLVEVFKLYANRPRINVSCLGAASLESVMMTQQIDMKFVLTV